ncbi:MAG: hypothetical protein AAB766_04470 [Patescibacteria group bacterium]
MQEQNNQTNNQEILEALKFLKGKAEEHSDGIKSLKEDVGILKKDVGILKEDVGILKEDVGTLKEDVGTLKAKAEEHSADIKFLKDNFVSLQESIVFVTETAATHEDIRRLETKMVTKEYLDDKIADVRGDLVAMTRKEDIKVNTLVETLETKKSLSKGEADKISALGPFPQLVL